MPGIEPGVLHDDRHVRFEHRGVVGIARDRRGIVEIVKAQMQGAASRNRQAVGTDRLAISEKNRDCHMRVIIARIEDAGGFVLHEGAIRK